MISNPQWKLRLRLGLNEVEIWLGCIRFDHLRYTASRVE